MVKKRRECNRSLKPPCTKCNPKRHQIKNFTKIQISIKALCKFAWQAAKQHHHDKSQEIFACFFQFYFVKYYNTKVRRSSLWFVNFEGEIAHAQGIY